MSETPNPEEHPFGKGWRILVIVVMAVIVVAIIVMAWGLLSH